MIDQSLVFLKKSLLKYAHVKFSKSYRKQTEVNKKTAARNSLKFDALTAYLIVLALS